MFNSAFNISNYVASNDEMMVKKIVKCPEGSGFDLI
jgi:hypothetical protein